MTKRLTPEEDAKAVKELDFYSGNEGKRAGDFQGEHLVHIDKSKYEMEVVSEGERFLGIKFKRRESVDVGKVVAFDELAPWPVEPESLAATGIREAEALDNLRRQFERLNFAGPAQERQFNAPCCPHGFKLNSHGFADFCPMFCGH